MSPTQVHSRGHSRREEALHRAVRLEWATFLFTVTSVTITYLALGNSQAMQTAWIQDLLSLVPPAAFLITAHIARRPASQLFPYGYHRATTVAHLVSSSALTVVGAFLIFDAVSTLLAAEHPPRLGPRSSRAAEAQTGGYFARQGALRRCRYEQGRLENRPRCHSWDHRHRAGVVVG